MAIASVDELKQRLDQRVVQYLTDDMEIGVTNETILQEILDGAETYVRAMLPTRFHSDLNLVKELVLMKALAMLYRRYGFFTEASTLDSRIASDIEQIVSASMESGRTQYAREPRYHSEEPIIDPEEWREAFYDFEG